MDECKSLGVGDLQGLPVLRPRRHHERGHLQVQGEAVQVDPINPTVKARESKRLKLKCDKQLSHSAFKFNLRRYIEGQSRSTALRLAALNTAGFAQKCGAVLSRVAQKCGAALFCPCHLT